MAIWPSLTFRPCVDADDPDDFRPNSHWAMASDPRSDLVVALDMVAAGDRVPLHTHTVDEVVVVTGGPARVQVGDEVVVVEPGAVLFAPAGTPHGGAAIDREVTFIGFFATPTIETTYLERNPAPGTEGQPPQASVIFDARDAQ
jgi:quercetin dioxygenase-like cupin family protein